MAKKRRIIPGQSAGVQFAEMRQDVARIQSTLQVLTSEVASRRRDPYEFNYMGVLQNNDPLVQEKGSSAYELYSDLMRDGKVFACYQKRVHTMIARPWQVTPVEESELGSQHAQVVAEILKRIRFDQVCAGFMDALLIGMSVAEVVWTLRDGYLVPERVVSRRQQRFVYKDVDENEPPQLRLITREHMTDGVALPPRKFIVHRVGSGDDNPYGQGLGLQLFWAVFFKRCTVVAWNKLNDRFGTPTAWGKYRDGAGKEEVNTLFSALKAISSDAVVMTPATADVKLLEAAMSGNITSHKELCLFMDNWIAGVLVGENGSENSGGALAAASTERRDILLDLVQADADLLSDTLNETLLKWICEFNGLEMCQVSRQIKEEKDLKAMAETYGTIARELGYRPTEEKMKDSFGEGWVKSAEPLPQLSYSPYGNMGSFNGLNSLTASFAEAQRRDGVELIDKQVQDMDADDLQDIMAGIIQPMLDAVNNSKSFEEAKAALQNQFPNIDSTQLEAMLAQMMFGSQVLGRGVGRGVGSDVDSEAK